MVAKHFVLTAKGSWAKILRELNAKVTSAASVLRWWLCLVVVVDSLLIVSPFACILFCV